MHLAVLHFIRSMQARQQFPVISESLVWSIDDRQGGPIPKVPKNAFALSGALKSVFL
jgi:hypothetical protein